MLVTICEVLSRIDFFSKKECTGCTRLMKKGIWTEKTSKIFNDLICEIRNRELYL